VHDADPGTVKAVRFARYGGPEVLDVVEVGAPHAQAGQVRIAVRAAGVNGLDWKIRQGLLRDVRPLRLPAGTGGDAAGIVDEVGAGVTDVRAGDAVFGSGQETYAEHAVLTSWAPKPSTVSFEEAAGFATPFETALRILADVAVHNGHTVLVNGASGGVGSAAVQFAVDRGARVIGVAGPSNQDYLASLGAVPTTYGPGLADRVRALAPAGVDAALDVAGSGVITELIELTGDPARVVSIADFNAPEHGARVSTGFGQDKAHALREGARLAAAGRLTLPVTRTFPLTQAAAAQAANATGHARGRIIVTVP
jgi:NADPH:quinone reductase-like Zn-dependent oxidoreductase